MSRLTSDRCFVSVDDLQVSSDPIVPSRSLRTFHFRLRKATTFLPYARYSLLSRCCVRSPWQSQLGKIRAVSSDPASIPITLLVVFLFHLIDRYVCVSNSGPEDGHLRSGGTIMVNTSRTLRYRDSRRHCSDIFLAPANTEGKLIPFTIHHLPLFLSRRETWRLLFTTCFP